MSFEQIMDLGPQKSFPLFHASYKEMCCTAALVAARKGNPTIFCHCLQSKLN